MHAETALLIGDGFIFEIVMVTASGGVIFISWFRSSRQWIRRKLRCIVWRQWKRPRIRERQLRRRGLSAANAKTAAYNGRGPWWSAGSQWVGQAIPTAELRKLGLVPLVEAQQRLAGVV